MSEHVSRAKISSATSESLEWKSGLRKTNGTGIFLHLVNELVVCVSNQHVLIEGF